MARKKLNHSTSAESYMHSTSMNIEAAFDLFQAAGVDPDYDDLEAAFQASALEMESLNLSFHQRALRSIGV